MPYTGADDEKLPEHVKELPDAARKTWVKTFNAVHSRCMEQDGKECEGRAMAAANAMMKRIEGGEMALPDGKSIDDVQKMVWEAFNARYQSPYGIQSNAWVIETYEDYIIANINSVYYRIPYTISEDKVLFAPQNEWVSVTEKSEWVEKKNALSAPPFLGVELSSDSALVDGKPFDGLSAGKFTDMLGRVVEFKVEEFQEYLSNTLEAILATTGESGELAGLPIDAKGHEKGDGAGWIVDAAIDGNKIRLTPRWTEIGRELISKGIRRFFSATVDVENKVILGGTLTNWPATRDKRGRILLRPVELSEPPVTAETTEKELTVSEETKVIGIADLSQAERDALLEQARAAVRDEVSKAGVPAVDLDAARAAMMAEAQKALELEYQRIQSESGRMLAEMVNKFKREQHIAEFSASVTTAGDKGLPVTAEEIERVLSAVDDATRTDLERIFSQTVQRGLVDFREFGHGKNPEGTLELEPAYRQQLDKWLAGGNELDEFFKINESVLGNVAQYNLSAYRKEK